MKLFIPLSFTSILFLGVSISTSASNLLDVYRWAEKGDSTFLASKASTQASNEKIQQSLAQLLPQLNLSFGRTYSQTKSTNNQSGLFTSSIDNPSKTTTAFKNSTTSKSDNENNSFNISLTQSLYNHSYWLRLEQTEKQALQAAVRHEGIKQDLMLRVSEAYFNVLAAKDNVNFSKAETQAVSQELAQTKQRFKVGLIAITNVHEAQSRYDRAIANQYIAQNALDNTHELLQLVTGEYHYDLLRLKKSIFLQNPQPQNIKKWVTQAESNNLDIKIAKIGLSIAKKNISIARSGHYPILELTASYRDTKDITDYPTTEQRDNSQRLLGQNSQYQLTNERANSSIGIQFSLPLYSGGKTHSQTKEARSRYVEASHILELKRRTAVSQTRRAYLGIIANIGSINAFKQAVVSSKKSLESIQAGFEVGTRTIVDVLQQTKLLFDAKRQYSRARYDYVLNTLKLKRATGLLSIKDLKTINQLLR
jgi:outer membrane protein